MEILYDFVVGNIYCVEISTEEHSVNVNAGVFLVNEEGCDNGRCFPLIFPVNRSVKPCYNKGDKLTFEYKAVCYADYDVAAVEICTIGGCTEVDEVPLVSGEYSLKLQGPDFRPGNVYYMALTVGDNLLLQTGNFFLTKGNCENCGVFQLYKPLEACYKFKST